MVIRVSVFLVAVLAFRPSRAAERSCDDCGGSGEVECASCKGDGTVVVPCGECVDGQAKCGKCSEGQVLCPRCGGRGSYFRGYRVGLIRPGEGGVVDVCRTTAPCPKCRGSALVGCKACGKKGTMVVQCFFCEGGKKEKCFPCYGTGKVGEPDLEPTAGTLEEVRFERVRARDQETDPREAVKVLEEAARSASKVDQDSRAVQEGMARLGTRIDALAKRASEEPALRQAAEHLRRRWKAAQGHAAETAREVERALSGALSGASTGESGRLSPEVEPGKAVARSSLDGIASARRQRKDIAAARGRVSGLVEDLRLREKEVGGFEARLKDYLASKDLERKKAEEVRAAYRRVEEKIVSTARKEGMLELECELLEAPSPGALRVQLTHFDEEATVSETPEESVPSDGFLARIPSLVSGVLRECPEVDRIKFVVDATCLTETGLEDRQTIQRFTMDRRRWKELVSGKYKGEWSTLLSKSQPSPEYPRPTRIPEGTWPIVVLLGICFLGLAIVLAVRTRMLS